MEDKHKEYFSNSTKLNFFESKMDIEYIDYSDELVKNSFDEFVFENDHEFSYEKENFNNSESYTYNYLDTYNDIENNISSRINFHDDNFIKTIKNYGCYFDESGFCQDNY